MMRLSESGWPYTEKSPTYNFIASSMKRELWPQVMVAIDTQKGQSHPQRRLMAIRASRLDAYRNMAEIALWCLC